MRVLITGGCGFIGSHLCEYHISKGDEVYIVDDLSSGSINNIESFKHSPLLHLEKDDIITWPHLDKIIKNVDRIYHLAAVVGVFRVIADPLKVHSTNIIGCDKILNSAFKTRSLAKIIIASSSSVYGNSPKSILNENDDLIIKPSNPLAPYAISKLCNESLASGLYQKHNLQVIIARFFNTIGPRQTGQYGMVVPRFCQQAVKNEPLTVFGDGNQTRSFCDVRDLIAMLELLIQNPLSIGQVINVGNNHTISINDLSKLVIKKSNSKSTIKHISYQEAYGDAFTDITQRKPDIQKVQSLTGYQHQWPLEKTIDNLISQLVI